MGKKSAKKSQSTKKTAIREQTPRQPVQFGYDEMLSELDAIVATGARRNSLINKAGNSPYSGLPTPSHWSKTRDKSHIL